LKKPILTILICVCTLLAKAQLGYNYAQYDFGLSGIYQKAYTDAATQKYTGGLGIHFTYNQTPYVNFMAEFQLGRISGGDSVTTLSGRQFRNNYKALTFRGQLQAGEFYDYSNSKLGNAFKNFYISSGIGLIYNHMDIINRNSLYIPDYTATGLDDSQEIFIPAKIGYEFKVFNVYNEPTFKVDIGYQHNFVLGDQLDGIKSGKYLDSFGQWVIGFKFAIGGVTSYRKEIHY
jgi:hypothetical protein